MNAPDLPRALVIGSTGYLGRALLAAIRQTHPEALGLTRSHCNLADPDLTGLDLQGYNHALICAAVPCLRHCHDHPHSTWQANVDGTLRLARNLAAQGIRPVWFSSDMVFSGSHAPYGDDAQPDPVNEYGRQKAAVEAAFAEASQGMGLVVRLSKVYGREPDGAGFLGGMVAQLRAGEPVRAAHDLGMNPTHIDDVVDCVLHLMRMGKNGLATVCGPARTRLEVAREVATRLGMDAKVVQSMSVDDVAAALDEPFRRPKRVALTLSPDLAGHVFRTIGDELDHILSK